MLKRYPGFEVVQEAPIIQMIADGKYADAAGRRRAYRAGPSDVPEMLRLTQQTNPGPFGPRTPELGQYIGVRVDGALAAMAGERMRLDGAVEISAVCVSPEHRGKGYAGISRRLARPQASGEGATPFLHAFTDNPAIALYERLGFRSARRSASRCWRALKLDRSGLSALQTGRDGGKSGQCPRRRLQNIGGGIRGGRDGRGPDDNC